MEAGTIEIETLSELEVISYEGLKLPKTYHGVILSRWLRSLKQLNQYFKRIDRDAYYQIYEKYLKSILTRPNVRIKLAVLKEDRDVLFGWSVVEGDVLHYVHVQEPYRKKGICDDLVPRNIAAVTHVTKHWLRIKKHKNVKFNPFL